MRARNLRNSPRENSKIVGAEIKGINFQSIDKDDGLSYEEKSVTIICAGFLETSDGTRTPDFTPSGACATHPFGRVIDLIARYDCQELVLNTRVAGGIYAQAR
jgi:hypothetical protein